MQRIPVRGQGARRRAIVVVKVAVMTTVLIGFAALSIDLSMMYVVRGELQAAADSSALAGASGYVTDEMMAVRLGNSEYVPSSIISGRASEYSQLNKTLGDPTLLEGADIVAGWVNLTANDFDVHTNAAPAVFNAVEVYARRTDAGLNGAVPYMFANIFGISSGETSVHATAVFDDRVSGFDPDSDPGVMTPFAISRAQYESQLLSGPDSFGYDGSSVNGFADGISEIHLFPHVYNGQGQNNGPGDGAGNFGLLNIGTGNQGVPALDNQIQNGVSAEDLETEIGTSDVSFVDEMGNPTEYTITGSPGIDASLESSVDVRVGDVIGFFLFDSVVDGGSTAEFTVTEMRFARVMEVSFRGNNKRLVVQPTIYAGAGAQISENAASTNGMVGRLVLVR